MSPIYDKPFKTFHEQIALMQSRGVIVNENSRTFEILSSISYFSLMNGYKNTFLKSPNDDIFIDGTTFEMIYQIYLLDSSIASILLKYILIVERSLKTKIAYRVSQGYDVHHSKYLDPNNYSIRPAHKRKRNELFSYLYNFCTKPYRNTISYYYCKNKNHVPPWIVVNDITFNKTIDWYEIMKAADKTYICQNMIPYGDPSINIADKKEFFINALHLLHAYRNSIAHGNKIFSPHIRSLLPKRPLFLLVDDSSILSKNEYNAGLGQKDLFAVFVSLILLVNNMDLIRSFFLDLSYVLDDYTDEMIMNRTYFELLGLPNDIMDRLLLLSSKKATFLNDYPCEVDL